MKIGIIGAGNIGACLATKFAGLGHVVSLANSRGPETLLDLAAETGAAAVSVAEAVRGVDLVIISIPMKGIAALPRDLFEGTPDDLIIVDTGNYYPGLRDDQIEAIESGIAETSWVARELNRPVLKAFNNIIAYSLAEAGQPIGAEGRIALPVAGDNARAKAIVIDLIDAVGFDGVDGGNMDDSWRQQPGTPVYCTDYDAQGVREALAKADKALAPANRDIFLSKMSELPKGFHPTELVTLSRSTNWGTFA
jgi:predicted dinucleotide-binding enzyme